jgi:hypothetical protein
MPRKRTPRQVRVRDLLNARTCSLRCDVLTAHGAAQAIFYADLSFRTAQKRREDACALQSCREINPRLLVNFAGSAFGVR